MKTSHPIRTYIFIALGIIVLLFKRHYNGPFAELVINQGSNFSVSFAIYFIGLIAFSSFPRSRLMAAVGALLAVESFELLNGFGVMTNVYDPWDLLANALGIGLALGIDLISDLFEKKSQDTVSREQEL
jgi:hypothetical protein